jgi:dipeptidyl aminopeptidase/acylaminoacyl peptidase
VIAEGRDFYSNPRISPDGARLCFLAWDLPWMPWDGCELFVAELGEGGELGPPYRVAGRDGRESIWQPEWSPSGDLVFASDRSGWWNLELVRGEERRALHPAESEFGFPAWTFGDRSFDFLSDGRLACIYERGGIQRVALLDLETADLADLDLPHTAIHRGPSIAAEGSAVVFIAGSPTIAPQVVWLDLSSRSIDVLRDSSAQDLDSSMVSVPRQIEFPTENGLTAHAHFYSPKNPSFVGPAGERPPLMVMSHGGPTGESTAILDLAHQFWTSRGFAVVDVNYGGSTGFGRAYRERLYGRWGVVDTQDCINAARYLVSTREVDSERLVIRGGSAGGYTTLCALAFYDAFAAGTSYYGVSDLEPFAQGQTHKFESQYEHTLIGPYPEAKDIYRERSPIHFVDRISCPMLLLQGAEDEVVPPAQSEIMVRALERNGLPHAYILFEGEQHGFRKATSIMAALEAELSFYGQILGFEPAGKLERLDVRNLD